MSKHKRKAKQISRKKTKIQDLEHRVSNKTESEENDLVDDLLSKAETCLNTFDYELAQAYCKRVLEQESNNIKALEILAGIFLEYGDVTEAKSKLQQSVELCPHHGHEKYFSLGQLYEGKESLEFYKKGISIVEQDIIGLDKTNSCEVERISSLNRVLSDAYCSVAEIYMTDCCFEDDADDQCKMAIENGIKADTTNYEAYQCLANYSLIKGEVEKAKSALSTSLSFWFPHHQTLKDGQLLTLQDVDSLMSSIPSYDSRITTSKLLIELQMFYEASEILECLVEQDDEVFEVWYLLGWMNYLQGEEYKGNAHYYFKKAKAVALKTGCYNEDQGNHINELMEELGNENESDISKSDNEADTYFESDIELSLSSESDKELDNKIIKQ